MKKENGNELNQKNKKMTIGYDDKDEIKNQNIPIDKEPENIDELQQILKERDSIVFQKKRGRGRPKKEEPAIELTKETLKSFIQTLFSTLASRLGEHWKLSEDEANILTDSYYSFLVAYSEVISDKFVIVYFVVSNIIVILPRILYKKKKNGAKDADKDKRSESSA